jgi:hypothetical protein
MDSFSSIPEKLQTNTYNQKPYEKVSRPCAYESASNRRLSVVGLAAVGPKAKPLPQQTHEQKHTAFSGDD